MNYWPGKLTWEGFVFPIIAWVIMNSAGCKKSESNGEWYIIYPDGTRKKVI